MKAGTAAILLGGLAALLSLTATGRGPGISPDSCHYLSMADNLLAGKGPETSITRWEDPGDSAPLASWPPGFPLLLAGFGWFGLSPEGACRAVLALSFAAAVVLTMLLAGAVEEAAARREDRPVRSSCALVAGGTALVSVPLLQLSAWAWSDLPFVAMSLLATLACLKAEGSVGRRASLWLGLAVVACATATMTRYAGVILWGTLVFWAWRIPRGHPTLRRGATWIALSVATLPFAAWLLRNRLVAGTMLYGRAAAVADSAPVLLLESFQAALADLLPFPVFGHSIETRIPWRIVATIAVGSTALVLVFLPGFSLARMRDRLRRHPEATFLLGAYGIVILGIAFSAILRDLSPRRIEQRLFAPAYPLLLAIGSVFVWPALAKGRSLANPFLRGTRTVAVVWMAYALVASVACVLFSRARPGFSDERFRTSPSSEYLRKSGFPRIATNFDVGVWYLTKRPVKLLPGKTQRRSIEDLASGAFDGALVIYKGDRPWSPYCVTLEQLEEAGLFRSWVRLEAFSDCEVFVRRR